MTRLTANIASTQKLIDVPALDIGRRERGQRQADEFAESQRELKVRAGF